MQKFYFKLQPLLNKERIYEDECAKRLRIRQNALQEEICKLENIIKQKIKCQEELKIKKQNQIIPAELRLYEDYFVRLDYKIGTGKCTIKEMAKKVEAVQKELIEIVKKRKALEKLKERKQEEYRSNLLLSLNKEMDDIAMTKFIRSKGAGVT